MLWVDLGAKTRRGEHVQLGASDKFFAKLTTNRLNRIVAFCASKPIVSASPSLSDPLRSDCRVHELRFDTANQDGLYNGFARHWLRPVLQRSPKRPKLSYFARRKVTSMGTCTGTASPSARWAGLNRHLLTVSTAF